MASTKQIREDQLAFVSELLYDSGKYRLPYDQQDKLTIELHLQHLLTRYASLKATFEDFIHNDGRSVGMIKLTGTLPILYNRWDCYRQTYNIPVEIWVTERYPNTAPVAYICVMKNMVIDETHPYVDRQDKKIKTPGIVNWDRSSSDLCEVIAEMCHIFGERPPLYTRQSMHTSHNPQTQPRPQAAVQYGYHPRPQPSSQFQSHPRPQPSQEYYPQFRPQYPYQPRPPTQHPSPMSFSPNQTTTVYNPTPTTNGYQQSSTVDLRDYKRKMLIEALSRRLEGTLFTADQSLQQKIAEAEEEQARLRHKAQRIDDHVSSLVKEREAYEENVMTMATIATEIANWRKNIPNMQDGAEIRPEDVIVPFDALHRQLWMAMAEDLAAEDTLNALDQLLQAEVINLDAYLKKVMLSSSNIARSVLQVRTICREQYFARAITMKIQSRPN